MFDAMVLFEWCVSNSVVCVYVTVGCLMIVCGSRAAVVGAARGGSLT